MRKLRSVFGSSLALLVLSIGCAAPGSEETIDELQGKVVYGADDRFDPFAYPDPGWAARAVEFTAAVVAASAVDASDPNDISIGSRVLSERLDVCPDERFASQAANADCSATLIAPDLVLTAGHCINTCVDFRFVFDYRVAADGTMPTLTQDDVYSCSSIVAYQGPPAAAEYAVARLTRPVVGRQPAPVRTARTALPVGTPLLVTGHPSGLPLKIANNAAVRSNSANLDFFVANLDTFVGNSGSGVFDANTKELVGILVRGELPDYAVTEGESCGRVRECPNEGCRGEDVVYAFRAIDQLCQSASSPLCPALEVLYDDHAPQPNWITPGIRVRNTSTAPVSLSGATARYYFTKEPPGTLEGTCWGCSVTPAMTFRAIPNGGCANANYYVDVALPNITLTAGATTEIYRLAFHASSWGAFTASNDYSYAGFNWDYAPNPNIALYKAGQRLYGTEPCPGIAIPVP